jgi:transcriptional regulator GlxA family with amidase domain
MSPRNFARSYKEKTGRTSAKAVEVFRIKAAKRLLETSPQNLEQIARSCGFGDEWPADQSTLPVHSAQCISVLPALD